jgi:hypothetical protein
MTNFTPPPRATDSWDVIPLAEQFRNHDEFRPEPTAELAGLSLVLQFASGIPVEVEIDGPTSLRWRTPSPTPWGSAGAEHYEAARVRDGIFAATTARLEENTSALIIVDLPGARALVNMTSFERVDGTMTEGTSVSQAGINGPLAAPFQPTTELVGKRVAHRYSATHVFEHIYLNPNTYAFQGLAGPEAGVADVDRADYWKLGDQLYLFSWHERAQPFNGAVVIDLAAGQATGRLVGWDETGRQTLQVRTGSIATLLSTTTYESVSAVRPDPGFEP